MEVIHTIVEFLTTNVVLSVILTISGIIGLIVTFSKKVKKLIKTPFDKWELANTPKMRIAKVLYDRSGDNLRKSFSRECVELLFPEYTPDELVEHLNLLKYDKFIDSNDVLGNGGQFAEIVVTGHLFAHYEKDLNKNFKKFLQILEPNKIMKLKNLKGKTNWSKRTVNVMVYHLVHMHHVKKEEYMLVDSTLGDHKEFFVDWIKPQSQFVGWRDKYLRCN